MNEERIPASHVYYFVNGSGRWDGQFSLRMTDWEAFWAADIGVVDRLLVLAMLLTQRVLGRPRITSRVRPYPEWGQNGVATNLVRITKFGVTLYKLQEQYVLAPNGRDVAVHSSERFGPIPRLLRRRKRHPADVASGGYHTTYRDMPLLGSVWTGDYAVEEDGDAIDATLTCPWATASEVIHRQARDEGRRPSTRSRAPGRSITSLEQLIDELERQAAWYEAVRDPRAVFAFSYARVTRAFAAALEAGLFDDTAWVSDLDVAFGVQYFSALDAWDLELVDPPGWGPVFRAQRAGRTAAFDDLVLSMAAHIVYDLPLALQRVGLGADRAHIEDYHTANDVLQDEIEPLQDRVTSRYSRLLRRLDELAQGDDELLTNYGIRLARAAAWYNAHRLIGGSSDAEASLQRSVAAFVQPFVSPTGLVSRLAQPLRWLANRFRSWGEEESAFVA